MAELKCTGKNVALFESLRAEGMTYKQIAERCGCSYQNVMQMMAKYKASQFRALTKERCIWDGLRNWLNENKMSNSELIRKRYGRNHVGQVAETLRRQMKGERQLKKDDIDFFRELTGLTYEELFCSNEKAGDT